MRFHVVWRKSHEPESAYRDFFETNDIDEAKDFAMRLAFDETNLVFVRDEKRDEVVRDFEPRPTAERRILQIGKKPVTSGHTKAGGDFSCPKEAAAFPTTPHRMSISSGACRRAALTW